MGVTYNYKRNVLYIADSYNHKIKCVTGLDNKQNHSGPSAGGLVHSLALPVKVNDK